LLTLILLQFGMARFGVAVCIKLLSEQRGYRDKTLNGR
jgi:hypothetical protein